MKRSPVCVVGVSITGCESRSRTVVDLLADDNLCPLTLRVGVAAASTVATEERLERAHHDWSNGRAILAMLDPSEVVGLASDLTGVWLPSAGSDFRRDDKVDHA